jgi:hypothetical protein
MSFQPIRRIPRSCVTFHNNPALYGKELLPLAQSPCWSTTACNYPPYLEAVSSIRNSRMHHDVVTGTHIKKQDRNFRLTSLLLHLTPFWAISGGGIKWFHIYIYIYIYIYHFF